MKKVLLFITALIASLMIAVNVLPQTAYAGGGGSTCSANFLGLRAWYEGLDLNADCSVKSSNFKADNASGGTLRKTIWLIVLNLAADITGIAGYVAICFVIWGGYQYMLAQGDPGKVVRGKKTITNALIGVIICELASTISGMIADIVSEAAGTGVNPFVVAMNHAFTWAAIIAVIVIVVGGIQYVTSNGNPSAVQKAKQTIMYAAIGLVISLMAVAIVNFAIGALN